MLSGVIGRFGVPLVDPPRQEQTNELNQGEDHP